MKRLSVLYLFMIGSFSLLGQGSITNQQISEAATQEEILRVAHILKDQSILDSLVDQVIAHSEVLKAFDSDKALYEEELLQKKRNWISSFRFGVNLFSVNTVASSDNTSVTTTGVLPNLGITLSVDPEKFVNRRSSMRQARIKYERAHHQQQAQKQTLKVYFMNQYYEYLELLEAVLMKKHIQETREQQYLTSEVAFKSGNIRYEQLMIVQNQFQLAELDVMKTYIQSLRKRSEIEIILGIQ